MADEVAPDGSPLEPLWSISKDGPHKLTWQRRWLARQLMDSHLSTDEAMGIVKGFLQLGGRTNETGEAS